jgi:hypothetical protein
MRSLRTHVKGCVFAEYICVVRFICGWRFLDEARKKVEQVVLNQWALCPHCDGGVLLLPVGPRESASSWRDASELPDAGFAQA